MAVQDDQADASMDLAEHMRTWNQFIGLIKWSIGSIAVLMLLLLIFRTHN